MINGTCLFALHTHLSRIVGQLAGRDTKYSLFFGSDFLFSLSFFSLSFQWIPRLRGHEKKHVYGVKIRTEKTQKIDIHWSRIRIWTSEFIIAVTTTMPCTWCSLGAFEQKTDFDCSQQQLTDRNGRNGTRCLWAAVIVSYVACARPCARWYS